MFIPVAFCCVECYFFPFVNGLTQYWNRSPKRMSGFLTPLCLSKVRVRSTASFSFLPPGTEGCHRDDQRIFRQFPLPPSSILLSHLFSSHKAFCSFAQSLFLPPTFHRPVFFIDQTNPHLCSFCRHYKISLCPYPLSFFLLFCCREVLGFGYLI